MGQILARRFFHEKESNKTEVRTAEEAEGVLLNADRAILRHGAMRGQEFKQLSRKLTVELQRSLRRVQSTAFNEKCLGEIVAGRKWHSLNSHALVYPVRTTK